MSPDELRLVYSVINDLAAPPIKEFMSLRSDDRRTTRTTSRGDCAVQRRSAGFGRSVFSVRATNYWNSVPSEIRESNSFTGFKSKMKSSLKSNQSCTHQSQTKTPDLNIRQSCYCRVLTLWFYCRRCVLILWNCIVVVAMFVFNVVKSCYCCCWRCCFVTMFYFIVVFLCVCLFVLYYSGRFLVLAEMFSVSYPGTTDEN